MSDIDMYENWREGLSADELNELYDHEYGWLEELSQDELEEYYKPRGNKDESYYIKSSEDDDNYIEIDDKSILHPDNPYHQKIIVRWDWVEIEGIISAENYKKINNELIGSELTYHKYNYTETYNFKEDYNRFKPNLYSRFRFKIVSYKDTETGELKRKVTLSIASNLLNDEGFKGKFKTIRSLLDKNTIKIRRVDLSFLILMDLSNINLGLLYSKTKTTIRNTDNNRIDTITLGTYKSDIRANLYNKKLQIEQKKRKTIDAIEYLYNFELTFHGNKSNKWDVTKWRTILKERVSFSKDILNYYTPKRSSDFALMYLFLNDKALFKRKYSESDFRRMNRHSKKLEQHVKDKGLSVNLVPLLEEVLSVNKESLSNVIYDLTTIKI